MNIHFQFSDLKACKTGLAKLDFKGSKIQHFWCIF